MNLDEKIRLVAEDGEIHLPIKNLLRITMVHLTKLLPEFYEDPDKQSNSINEFWKWIEKRLGMGKGKTVLM